MTSRDIARADHLLDLGRHSQAEEILRAHLATDPNSAEALRLLVLALLGQERAAEALDAAEAAVREAPEEEHGFRLLSIVYARLDRTNDAVRAAREAVRAAPGMWQTHYTLGMALRTGRMPRTRDALDCANEAVRLAPHESSPYNLAGLCLDDLRMPVEAQRAYEEALRLDPQSATALNNLAATTAQRGRLAAAARLLSAGLSSDPQEAMLHDNYDRLLLALVLRLNLLLLGFGILFAVLVGADAAYAIRVVTVLVLLGSIGLLIRSVARNLPRGSHLWARGMFRRVEISERIFLGVFLLLAPAVLALGLAPLSTAPDIGMGILVTLRTVGIAYFVLWALGPVFGAVQRWRSRKG